MPRRPGLRERKKLATRDALAAAALRLAAERGIERLTVEDIAATVDVSPRTFFNYFATKEEAVLGGRRDSTAEVYQAFDERPAAEPLMESLAEVLRSLARRSDLEMREHAVRMRLVKESPAVLARYLSLYAEVERALADRIAQRAGLDPARELYPGLLAAASTAALRVVFQRWAAEGETRSLDRLLDEAVARLADGFARPAPGHRHQDDNRVENGDARRV